jgi:hypothetical protein
MTRRARYILLGLFIAAAVFLAIGAWQSKPGEDPDNQGGATFALLGLLIVVCFIAVKITRGIGSRMRSRLKPRE